MAICEGGAPSCDVHTSLELTVYRVIEEEVIKIEINHKMDFIYKTVAIFDLLPEDK